MGEEAEFLQLSEGLASQGIDMLPAMLIAAAQLGIAQDSRSFARLFGVEHALVLRALVALEHEDGLILATSREERSLRLHFRLSPAAMALVATLQDHP